MKQLLVSFPFILALSLMRGQIGMDIQVEIRDFSLDKAYLGFYYGGQTLLHDSSVVRNGRFSFHSDTPLPQGMYLLALPPEMEYVDFFLDEDQVFSLRTEAADPVGKMEVEGSRVNEVFFQDLQRLRRQEQMADSLKQAADMASNQDELKEIQQQLKAMQSATIVRRQAILDEEPTLLYARFLRAIQGPEIPQAPVGAGEDFAFYFFRKHYFDVLDLSDPAMLRTPIAREKVMDYLQKYTMQAPDSLTAAIDEVLLAASGNQETYRYYLATIFNHYLESKRMGAEPVAVYIAERYYLQGGATWADEAYIDQLRDYVRTRRGTLVGETAPDFVIADLTDRPVRFHDTDADWIVLYFWSYDCATCQRVTPTLREVLSGLVDQGVSLVTVCTNGDRDIWKGKVAEYGLPGIHLADPARESGFDKAYHLRSTPTIYLLDRDFVIRYKEVAIEDLGAILDYELGR